MTTVYGSRKNYDYLKILQIICTCSKVLEKFEMGFRNTGTSPNISPNNLSLN